jgi:hypothetical protein
MTKLAQNKEHKTMGPDQYRAFERIDGSHPMREAGGDCFVDYRVRTRHGGKVAAFNFTLAREMGLISKGHPDQLTPELERAILETFSVVIINEYDIEHGTQFPKGDIRDGACMATRYLQLQHPNKQGKTSGDGRSIWNGHISHNGKTWDLSSCGTGATRLSPATHIHKKFWKTGDPSISYGCGYSDLDEGLSTLFFSEILHKNKLPTERVLAVIEYPKSIAVTVRAHHNLLRPSHLFAQLRQGNLTALKALVDYYITRQELNGEWKGIPKRSRERYDYFLKKQTEIFATMSSTFEDEYIFCWLDWDGDNILMDGGIIDYGSVRQFGLFHAEYRYDDVDRYSTTILEQKRKARYIVQCFAQIVDFLHSGEKKNVKKFARHKCLKDFERIYEENKDKNLLKKIGYSEKMAESIFGNHRSLVRSFRDVFSYFEKARSKRGPYRVTDGIMRDAIFCMRDVLRELPQLYLSGTGKLKADDFLEIAKSSYCKPEDLKKNIYRHHQVARFQKLYWDIAKKASRLCKMGLPDLYLELSMRSAIINKYDRITGDSITTITDKIMQRRPKVGPDEMQAMLKDFVEYQNLDPDTRSHMDHARLKQSRFMRSMLDIVREYREGL